MTACSLFVVVDEYIVPGEGSHIKGVQGAEHPDPGDQQQGKEENM